MSARRLPPALLALSPGDLDRERAASFPRAVAAARAAGLRGLLLREPGLGDRDLLALARELRALLEPGTGGWLGLHDRAHLAAAAEADALHLGWRSLAPDEVRGWIGPRIALGLSAHAGDDPRTWACADYLLLAPVFQVPGKGPPLGLQGLTRALRATPVPAWALGGIGPEHARDLIEAGARGVAVLRGILGRPDPGAAVRAYLGALGDRGAAAAP